ncbi:MAG: tRNA (N6-threonylcarbamoyladenosine(37)-N6)-methyltransferase TrmO, partial [Pseudomonadaceae bacterium]
PKPAYQQPGPAREYGVRLWDLNVRFHYPQPGSIRVLSVMPCSTS